MQSFLFRASPAGDKVHFSSCSIVLAVFHPHYLIHHFLQPSFTCLLFKAQQKSYIFTLSSVGHIIAAGSKQKGSEVTLVSSSAKSRQMSAAVLRNAVVPPDQSPEWEVGGGALQLHTQETLAQEHNCRFGCKLKTRAFLPLEMFPNFWLL